MERFNKEKHLRDDVIIYVEPGVYSVPFLIEKALGDKKIHDYFEDELIQSWNAYPKITVQNNLNLSLNGSVRGSAEQDHIKLKQVILHKGSKIMS